MPGNQIVYMEALGHAKAIRLNHMRSSQMCCTLIIGYSRSSARKQHLHKHQALFYVDVQHAIVDSVLLLFVDQFVLLNLG
jgi:hypothetical protein